MHRSRRRCGNEFGRCALGSRSISEVNVSKIDEVENTVRTTPGLGKKMAKYGAIGAVVAIPVPFVGPVLGAIVGAAVAYSKRPKF